MASKKQNRRSFDTRQSILIVYVGVCVIAVVLTVFIAFSEVNSTSQLAQPTATRTLSPAILTQQAEGSANTDAHPLSTPTRAAADAAARTVTATLDADEH